MRFLDAILVLALAARIHRTDTAVRSVAKTVAKLIEPRYKSQIVAIMKAPKPCAQVELIVATLPDWILQMNPEPRPVPAVASSFSGIMPPAQKTLLASIQAR